MIEVLLEKGYAYIAGENVYFDTSKLDNYYVYLLRMKRICRLVSARMLKKDDK